MRLLSFLLLVYTVQLCIAQDAEDKVRITDEKTETGLIIYGFNDDMVPYTVEINVQQTNLKSNKKFPLTTVLPPQSSQVVIAALTAIMPDKGWSYGSQFTYYMGDHRAQHDDDFVYALPFDPGDKFIMSQGYNGAFSHAGKNAIDFTMPEGTKIRAARGGLVVTVKEDSNVGCPYRSCLEGANKITIFHEDGTFADYVHLQKDGSIVSVGDRVKTGDLIGFSGATGFASGPHLHFEVFRPERNENGYISIKTNFNYAPGKKGMLKEGEFYEAF